MNKVWTEEDKIKVKEYLSLSMTNRQLASLFNCGVGAIERFIYRNGLSQFRKQKEEKPAEPNELLELDDKEFDKIKELAKIQWEVPKTKIKPNTPKEFKTYLVVADIHIPEQNSEAVKCVLKVMDDIKLDGFINLGDYLDLACISHWNKNKRKKIEGKRLKEDYILGNALLDEFDKRLPQKCDKRFLKGNHELWVDDMVDEQPMLDGLFDIDSALKLKERGYSVSKYNEIIRIGKLNLTHGIYACANAVKKHLDECKTNIMFGHIHTTAEQLSSSPARQLAFAGYSVGCLSDLAPDYAKNRPNAWSHGFAIVYFYPNGNFQVDNVRIIQGKCILNGKEYSGK